MAPPLMYSEKEIWSLVAEGNEKAFTELYHLYSPHIFQVALQYSGQDANLAVELVQQVFIRVWEKRIALAAVNSGEDYLFILARNLIFDYFKKTARESVQKKDLLVASALESNETEERLQGKEIQTLLNQAIAQLPPQQRKVYQLAKQDGISQEEIAAQLQLSLYTVQTHMKLATRAIRVYIRDRIPAFITPLLLGLLIHRYLLN